MDIHEAVFWETGEVKPAVIVPPGYTPYLRS